MQIKWSNVFALGLLVVALVVFVRGAGQIGAFLSAMGNIGPGHTPGEQTMGLISFGIVLVSILAVALIVRENRRTP